MFNKILISLFFYAFFISSASAAFVDFEDLNEADSGASLISGGVTFTAGTGAPILAIFNTDCLVGSCTGDDDDLSFPGMDTFGLVLIINEQNPIGVDGPDDDGNGGEIIVDFASLVTVGDLVFLDIEGAGSTVTAFNDGMEVGLFNIIAGGDNAAATTSLGDIVVDQLVIDFETSGALAIVDFTAVPLPAALPMFLGGLGLIFALRRKPHLSTA